MEYIYPVDDPVACKLFVVINLPAAEGTTPIVKNDNRFFTFAWDCEYGRVVGWHPH
ncbi:hypothetical protein [Porticoccus sp.]